MRALSAEELLHVWEQAQAQAPAGRALALLAVACPDLPPDSLAALSIGQRDAWLLTLREWIFGSRMNGIAACPGCGDRLELPLSTEQMRAGAGPNADCEIALSVAGYDVRFRPPNTGDAISAANLPGWEDGRRLILSRCLLSSGHGDDQIDPGDLPEEVVAAISQRMAEADSLADIQMIVSCPRCQCRWRALFDIVSFFWTEIEAWAWRILSEVHTLAAAYGWPERDILNLAPRRRQFYLEMAGV